MPPSSYGERSELGGRQNDDGLHLLALVGVGIISLSHTHTRLCCVCGVGFIIFLLLPLPLCVICARMLCCCCCCRKTGNEIRGKTTSKNPMGEMKPEASRLCWPPVRVRLVGPPSLSLRLHIRMCKARVTKHAICGVLLPSIRDQNRKLLLLSA